jgi:hypothetical protein
MAAMVDTRPRRNKALMKSRVRHTKTSVEIRGTGSILELTRLNSLVSYASSRVMCHSNVVT